MVGSEFKGGILKKEQKLVLKIYIIQYINCKEVSRYNSRNNKFLKKIIIFNSGGIFLMKKKNNNKILVLTSLLLFLPLLAGCVSAPATDQSPIITSISVLPVSMTIKKGQSQTIDSITAYYSNEPLANIELNACTYQSNVAGVTATNGVIKVSSICLATSATITVSYTESGVTKSDTVNIAISCGCGG